MSSPQSTQLDNEASGSHQEKGEEALELREQDVQDDEPERPLHQHGLGLPLDVKGQRCDPEDKLKAGATKIHNKGSSKYTSNEGDELLHLFVKNTFLHVCEDAGSLRRYNSAPPELGIKGVTTWPSEGLTDSTAEHPKRQSKVTPTTDWKNVLTVMMRNVPTKYSQQLLVEEICSQGFQGCFDFLHIPANPSTRMSKGYAFINFTTPHLAWQFKCTFEGRPMKHFHSRKTVSICPATLQGYSANYQHFVNTLNGNSSFMPLFLRGTPALSNQPANRLGRMQIPSGTQIPAENAQEVVERGVERERRKFERERLSDLQGILESEVSCTELRGALQEFLAELQELRSVGGGGGASFHGESRSPPQRSMAIPEPASARICDNCGEQPGEAYNFCIFCGIPLAAQRH